MGSTMKSPDAGETLTEPMGPFVWLPGAGLTGSIVAFLPLDVNHWASPLA